MTSVHIIRNLNYNNIKILAFRILNIVQKLQKLKNFLFKNLGKEKE